ncbi:hypothetical protein ACOME3_003493 [Neoechinorhynchus agilis]
MDDNKRKHSRLSLEQCFTNVFGVSSIENINWRCFVAEDQSSSYDATGNNTQQNDLILDAFASCLENNVLSAWKRSSTTSKELWVFWFDNDEQHIQVRIDPSFKVKYEGKWAASKTLHKRDMLFKAFHNAFERSLLLSGFVRIGRWFVQPETKSNFNKQAFSFNFFIHGECWLCCTLDVRSRIPVRRVSSYGEVMRLAQSENSVILSPYGLEAVISKTQPIMVDKTFEAIRGRTILTEFARFYPLDKIHLDELVQVEIPADTRRCTMLYPRQYILYVQDSKPKIFANYFKLPDDFCEMQMNRLYTKRTLSRGAASASCDLVNPPLSESCGTITPATTIEQTGSIMRQEIDDRKRRAEVSPEISNEAMECDISDECVSVDGKRRRVEEIVNVLHNEPTINPYNFEIDPFAKPGVPPEQTTSTLSQPPTLMTVHFQPPPSVKPPTNIYSRMIASLEAVILTPPDSTKQPFHHHLQRASVMNTLSPQVLAARALSPETKKTTVVPNAVDKSIKSTKVIDSPPLCSTLISYNPEKGRIIVASLKKPSRRIKTQRRLVESVDPQPKPFEPNAEKSTTVGLNSVALNIRLSDSIVNLWRDVNYDTCTSCACGRKESTESQESQLYLGHQSNTKWACSCGFSAVVHQIRINEYSNGLFERDLSGPIPKVDMERLEVIRQQHSTPFVLHEYEKSSVQFYSPTNKVIDKACVQTVLSPIYRDSDCSQSPFHWWTNTRKTGPYTHAEGNKEKRIVQMAFHVVRLLKECLAIKRNVKMVDNCFVGPLTWTQFHHLMNTKQQDRLQKTQTDANDKLTQQSPTHLPIPHLQFGDSICAPAKQPGFRSYLSASPFILKVWETLDLEPYGGRRNVGYVVSSKHSRKHVYHTREFGCEGKRRGSMGPFVVVILVV